MPGAFRCGGEIVQFARQLRRDATDAEAVLWRCLRGRRLRGAKFRRQVPIYGAVVDFYCAEQRLIVEADGGGHFEPGKWEEDRGRDEKMRLLGVRVLRFSNDQVLFELEGVLQVIWDAVVGG